MATIFESPTYPGSKNNNPTATTQPFRDLSIINQPAGFIEFANTEGDETLSIVHNSGAMLQFSKHFTGMLNPNGFKSHTMGDSFQQNNGSVTMQSDKGIDMIQLGDSHDKSGDISKWQKPSEDYINQIKPIHNKKRLFEIKRVSYKNFIDQAPEQQKSGKLAPCPSSEYQAKQIYTVLPTIYIPGTYAVAEREIMSLEPPELIYEKRISANGKMFQTTNEEGELLEGWYSLTSWGTGESPSSQDGKWDKENLKDDIESEYGELSKSLVDTEKQFGQNSCPEGGNKISKVGKSKVEMIGTAFNSMESIRIDPLGKLVQYGVKIDPFGSGIYLQHRESPLVETVHVDSGIGGDYVQTICDKWAVNVGSNGIHFKTSGQFNLFGSIINILGEQITIHSRNEICLGAERVDIEGEIITLRPKPSTRKIEDSSGNYRNLPANGKDETERERQVLVDGNLNISQNVIIKGGTHIEGELTVQHITAPLEYQVTDTDFEIEGGMEVSCEEVVKRATYGDMVKDKIIGKVVGDNVISVDCADAILVHPHYHYFKNIPLRLFRDATIFEVTVGSTTQEKELTPYDAVRAIGARNNFDKPVLPMPIQNSETSNTVIEKFGGSCEENLVINNGDWVEPLEEDKLPSGEGVASEKYKQNILSSNKKKLDEKIVGKYKDLNDLCMNTTKNTTEARINTKGLA